MKRDNQLKQVNARSGEKSLCVFGLGKLGLPLAALLAEAGHVVRSFDPNPIARDQVRERRAITYETGLEEILEDLDSNLSVQDHPLEALRGSEVVYLIVPTPSLPDGSFDNSALLEALQQIALSLRDDPRFLVVVVCSTVSPGSSENILIPALEEKSGLKVGVDFGFVYSPEFIALGSVVKDMKNPDLVLVGESDAESGEIVEEIALSMVVNTPSVHRISIASAELAKIAVNTFVTAKISYANFLGEICEKLPGADIDEVTTAVGADGRIGQRYLRAALGYGGPCFPRDNRALAAVARNLGVGEELALATDSVNNRQVNRNLRFIADRLKAGSTVCVVGLAYKEATPVLAESQALAIALGLAEQGYRVFGLDPLVSPEEVEHLQLPATFSLVNKQDELPVLDAVIFTHSDSGTSSSLCEGVPPHLIFDLWGEFGGQESPAANRPGRKLKEK